MKLTIDQWLGLVLLITSVVLAVIDHSRGLHGFFNF